MLRFFHGDILQFRAMIFQIAAGQRDRRSMNSKIPRSDHQKGMQKIRATAAQQDLRMMYDNLRVDVLAWGISTRTFERTYGVELSLALDTVIYRDVDAVLEFLANCVRRLEPDASVLNSRYVEERLVSTMMWRITSSIRYWFARRRELPPDWFRTAAALDQLDVLPDTILRARSRDQAIFLGVLAGLYIKRCPKQLCTEWAARSPIVQGWPPLLVQAMESELLLRIDF